MVKQRPEQVAKLLKRMNIHIRNIPEQTLANLDAEAERQGTSRQEVIISLLDSKFGEQPMVLGYVKLDRPGEFDQCAECNQPIRGGWLQFLNNGVVNLVCEWCATSE